MNKVSTISLGKANRIKLEEISRSEQMPFRARRRADILLYKAAGMTSDKVADILGVNRHTVNRWVNRYKYRNKKESLEELLNIQDVRGRHGKYSVREKEWIISIAESCPRELGYNLETWTMRALAECVNSNAKAAGFTQLGTLSDNSVYKIVWTHRKKQEKGT